MLCDCCHSERKKFQRSGLSLVELMVVALILAILLAILLVGMQDIQHKSATLFCRNNLRQLGTIMQHYTTEYDGYLPKFSNYTWCGQVGMVKGGLYRYKLGREYPDISTHPRYSRPKAGWMDRWVFIVYPRHDDVFKCPTAIVPEMNVQGVRSSYAGLSKYDHKNILTDIEDPSTAILFFEYKAKRYIYSTDYRKRYATDDMKPPEDRRWAPPIRVAANHGYCGHIMWMDLTLDCYSGNDRTIPRWEKEYTSTLATTTTSIPKPDDGGDGGDVSDGDDDDRMTTTTTSTLSPWLGPPLD